MTELAWTTIAGKRVLPVLGHAGMCGTRGSYHARINCAFYAMASGDCLASHRCEANTFSADAIFITKDQLPEYLARKLVGDL